MCSALLVFACVAPLFAERLVVGIGHADPAYLEARQREGGPRRETYVFMPGNYVPGMSHDSSLEKMPFRRIAGILAPDLQRQNYHPAETTAEADLLLVIHWGATAKVDSDIENNLTDLNAINELNQQHDDSAQRDTAIMQEGSFAEQTATLMGQGVGERSDMEAQIAHETMTHRTTATASALHSVGRDNASILGIAAALSTEHNSILYSERHKTLHDMTKEERYFIVVMAYDMPALLKTGKLRRLWTARLSIRSAGVNFGMAVERISQVAGEFVGSKTGDVIMKKARKREGSVSFGDFKVLGVAEGK